MKFSAKQLSLSRSFESEKYVDAKIAQLVTLYKGRARAISARLRGVDISDFEQNRLTVLLSQVNREIAFLTKQSTPILRDIAKRSYLRGENLTSDALAGALRARTAFGATIHKSAVNVVADQLVMDFTHLNQNAQRTIHRFLMQSRQTAIEDTAITEAVGKGLIEGSTRRQVSGQIYKAFSQKIGDGKFIEINGRQYNLADYSELLARTRTREAVTQGQINTCLQFGVDLIQVSVHDTDCEVCLPFQGKVYSISGSSGRFPKLTMRPPYHPNCKHVLLPVPEGALSEDEEDALSKFSRGKGAVGNISEYVEMVG